MRQILVVAFVALVRCAVSQGPAPGPDNGATPLHSRGAQTGAGEQNGGPAAPKTLATDGPSHSDRADNPKREPDESPQEWWTVPAALGPVFIGACTLAVIAWQACEMRRLNGLTRISADAAAKSANAAEVALRRTGRAYLRFKNRHFGLTAGLPFEMRLVIENTGQSEARNIRVGVVVYPVRPATLPARPDGVPMVPQDGLNSLVPNSDHELRILTDPLSEEDVRAVSSGEKIIYYHARVAFEDVFDTEYVLGLTRKYDHAMSPPGMLSIGGPEWNYYRESAARGGSAPLQRR